MADKVVATQKQTDSTGAEVWSLAYYVEFSPAITDFNGATVVPQKSIPGDLNDLLTQAEQEAVAAGSAIVLRTNMLRRVTDAQGSLEGAAAFKAAILADKDRRAALEIQRLRALYANRGQSFSA